MTVRLATHNLSVRYRNGIEAIKQLNLEVTGGEFLVLLGPSGCGKTTLLDLFAGLLGSNEADLSGDILVDGVNPLKNGDGIKKRIGYVFERNALLPWRTVIENVELGLLIQGMSHAERRAKSCGLLNLIGLSDFKDHYPHELSAGMKQRVSFARTLAYDPEIVLMDEPFGALDLETRLRLQAVLLRLWEQMQVTVLLVTHDVDEAVTLGNRIILLSKRPASIRKTFHVMLPHPRDPYKIRGSEQFAKLTSTIWRHLASELESD